MLHDARDAVTGERAYEARLGKIVLSLRERFVEARLAGEQFPERAELVAFIRH
ncbi:MAG TPA: hypothetical protein VNG31_10005 [Candidatus Baltobacteraceae bacterium]|nr:hypothetical protein [Candidatus Baltobacteraceae bacterium]